MRICSGCQHTFTKTHILLNHRRSFRCGGEWNKIVFYPTHDYLDTGEMIYAARPGARYSEHKPKLADPSLFYDKAGLFRHNIRKAQRKKSRRHKHRTPGTVRASRLHGGCGFRNNWQEDAKASWEG